MGLCGCAEKHDAAEEIEEFTLEGESDVGKNSQNSKTESEKGSQDGKMQKKDCRRRYMFMYVEL